MDGMHNMLPPFMHVSENQISNFGASYSSSSENSKPMQVNSSPEGQLALQPLAEHLDTILTLDSWTYVILYQRMYLSLWALE